MASASRDLTSRVTDVVTCPICRELFDSPKSLPCLHTFCLKCIEDHCTDKKPGSKQSCPVCRQKFKIPDNGVHGLVSNFVIADLLEARKIPSDVVLSAAAAAVRCEMCLAVNCSILDDSNVAASTMYCVDCDQKLCEQCSRPHRKMNGEAHKVVPMWNEIEMDWVQALNDKCDKHNDDDATLYCLDCKMNVCVSCCTDEHQLHKCYYVGTLAARCVEQIDADIELVKRRADGARNEISRLEQERCKFLAGVDEVGEKILERGEELKQLIDRQMNELMAEVRSLTTETNDEIDRLIKNIEMKLMEFETFSAYCSELKSEGKPCDITRAANDLHIRATELLQNDVTLTDCSSLVVTFKSHELLPEGPNLVGVVNPKEMIVGSVVHTLPEAQPVVAVTSLGDELYVLRVKAKDQVEVYKITTTTTTTTLYSLLRHLSVLGVKALVDMTSCKHYRCLYVGDWSSKCVHRVELNGKVTKWSVNYKLCGLSVTSQFTVIVTCCDANLLFELTTEGKQLREINLHPHIPNPYHAIQLSNGQFVVCHGGSSDSVHRVCIVDTNGHVTQSYGGPRGSATVGQLNAPVHLAVDKDEFIYVLDNRRVLLLSPTLSFVQEVVSRDQFMWKPRMIFLDVDRRRLYVADSTWIDGNYNAGRVVFVQL